MADQTVVTGVQGGLPNLPRKALNNSVIAAEQAYRKRKGLPPLSPEEIYCLKQGIPMPWEPGGTMPDPAAVAAELGEASAVAPAGSGQGGAGQAAQNAVPAGALPTQNAAPAADVALSNIQGGLPNLPRKALNNSVISAEQAYRKKKGLAPLSNAEIYCLKQGIPMPWEPGGTMPDAAAVAASMGAAPAAAAQAPAAAKAATASAAPAARPVVGTGPALTRTGVATKYVGSPAVGTSQAAAAGGVATQGQIGLDIDRTRRRLVWSCVAAFLAAWLLAFFRFFLPRTIFEPNTVFKIGYPSDYAIGVDTKFQQKFRIWVDRTPDRLFVIYARCTHLGCTPDWKPAENKFKCPCHGSGYDSEGINFEGPAPRPMDRAKVSLDPTGQIVVDTSKLYQQPKGQPTQFNDQGAFINLG
ncbi:MAG TPA: Rieske 2Fe-2S domain-containing protein [Terriglobales bacterium]|nr:Rieske 2Fe-2S domain-containing protein [Terriglobales bacterium]